METIGYHYTDGGRKQAGIKDDRDCTVRALSIFFDIDYAHAHKVCAKFGRKNKRGFSSEKFKKAIKSIIRQTQKNAVQVARKGSVQKIIKKYCDNNLLILLHDHAFAVKNGIIMDSWKPSINCHVKHAWIIKDLYVLDYAI